MSRYSVYYDPDGMSEICELSPFNLKKDLKKISESELLHIAVAIADEIRNGDNRPPAYAVFLGDALGKISCAKIRTMDIEREAGKSNGYRCIVLADNINKCAFLLHVYRHGHGEDENISNSDKNKLKKLVKEYSDALKAQS